MDTDTLFISEYPADAKTAARLVRYWLEDQDIRVEDLLSHLGAGLSFERVGSGWSVHTSSEMAVPPHIEQPSLYVHPSRLWQLGLLACIASRWPLATVLSLPCSTPMHAAMNLAVVEQLTTPPAVAMCLCNLLHPGLTQQVQLTAQKYVMRCGPDAFSQCLADAMSRPLVVSTLTEHRELLSAVGRGQIRLIRHATISMIRLPCSVGLVCNSTDHLLLYMLLLYDKSSLVSGLSAALRQKTQPKRAAFWHVADSVHTKTFKTCTDKQK